MIKSKKTWLKIFAAFVSVVLCSCSNSKDQGKETVSPDASLAVENPGDENPAAENVEVEKTEPETAIEKDYLTMDEFLDTRYSYEKGGVSILDGGYIFDVPEKFKKQEVRIFGDEEEYMPPEKPYTKIFIGFMSDGALHVNLPESVFDEHPELYLEAEHDGKIFAYQEKKPIDFRKETNSKNELIGYHAYISFENRNLYSKSDKWNLTLRDCHDGTILASETVSQKPSPCGYTVYTGDHGYESPFVGSVSVNRYLESGKPYHMIYKGKGGSFPILEKGTMIVFSYCYYYDGKSKLLYVPFLGVQTKGDENGVCSIDFSIKEPGQYKIDFYDVATGEINLTSFFDYLAVKDDADIKYVEKVGTRWKVNSAEGLRLRDFPWGEKIALLENGTELIQTEETHYPFYDFIDAHGFWIPVKYADSDSQNQGQEKKHVYCLNEEKTDGWVFSGFLERLE
ncbi:MAG: hypothetical protein ILP07_11825 [Treponema sp.]|nr:hypothetical protein [Treponema sp.]